MRRLARGAHVFWRVSLLFLVDKSTPPVEMSYHLKKSIESPRWLITISFARCSRVLKPAGSLLDQDGKEWLELRPLGPGNLRSLPPLAKSPIL